MSAIKMLDMSNRKKHTNAKGGRHPDKPKDQHKVKAFQLRLNPEMRAALDALRRSNGSKATEEIRIAIRKHLQENKLWPPPAGPN